MDRFNLSRWAVRQPALIGFLIALLFATGTAEFFALPRAEDPSFTLKEMIVAARWPGAAPDRMRSLVAGPIERKLRGTESLDFQQSYCVEGACVIQLALRDDAPKQRVPGIWQQVRREIADVAPDLPAGAQVSANDDYSDVYGYVFAFAGADNRRLVQIAERTRDAMLRLPGAAKAQIVGEVPRRLFVDVDAGRLAGMGIAPGQLAQALAQRAAVTPAGISESALRVPVRVDGAPDGIDTLSELSVATPAGPMRVGDLATVSNGHADPPDAFVRHAGRPAVVLAIAMAPGADGLGFGAALRTTAAAIARTLPAGVRMTQVEDQSAVIREAIDAFMIKFFCALTVVLVVAFLTLGWRTGIVVALSVPLTLAIVALAMGAAGIGLERISLGALILSLGLLVDDAIISVEAMVVQMEKGAAREEAAAYAWTHTAFPMLTGTLLTIVGFLPVGFARSTTSEYADGIFWVTGAALIVSWVVAVVFTPYLGVRLLPAVPADRARHDPHDTPAYRRLRRIVGWCLDHRWLVVGATGALLLVSLAGAGLVRQQFFPTSDRPELIVDVALRPGSAIGTTQAAVRRIEAAIGRDPDLRSIDSYIGEGTPRFYLPYGPALPNPARATLMLVAADLAARERLAARLATLHVAPAATLHVRRLSLGPSTGFPVQYRVIGPDPERLRAIAAQIVRVLRTTPGARDVQTDWGSPAPATQVHVDGAALARLGTDRSTLEGEIDALVSGHSAGEVLDGSKRIGIVVRAASRDRGDPGQLADLTIRTPAGAVPLRAVARIGTAMEQPIVWSRDGARCLTVQADMTGDVQAAQLVDAAEPRLAAIRAALPNGYRIEDGGDGELSAKANGAIYDLLPVTLAAMLLLLMIQLRSVGRTLLVLATAPLGIVGAVAALLVTGAPFGFVALLGLIALAGMIMRNAIILVDQVSRHEAEGMTVTAAIVTATVGRSRPVVLTALAAVLAFIPLCFNVFWGPMAIVMIGGLIGATIMTLVSLPALFALAFARHAAEETIDA
jgi:multidrug efflux pump subunit AcrB